MIRLDEALTNHGQIIHSQIFAEFLHGGPVPIGDVDRVRDTLVFDGPG